MRFVLPRRSETSLRQRSSSTDICPSLWSTARSAVSGAALVDTVAAGTHQSSEAWLFMSRRHVGQVTQLDRTERARRDQPLRCGSRGSVERTADRPEAKAQAAASRDATKELGTMAKRPTASSLVSLAALQTTILELGPTWITSTPATTTFDDWAKRWLAQEPARISCRRDTPAPALEGPCAAWSHARHGATVGTAAIPSAAAPASWRFARRRAASSTQPAAPARRWATVRRGAAEWASARIRVRSRRLHRPAAARARGVGLSLQTSDSGTVQCRDARGSNCSTADRADRRVAVPARPLRRGWRATRSPQSAPRYQAHSRRTTWSPTESTCRLGHSRLALDLRAASGGNGGKCKLFSPHLVRRCETRRGNADRLPAQPGQCSKAPDDPGPRVPGRCANQLRALPEGCGVVSRGPFRWCLSRWCRCGGC